MLTSLLTLTLAISTAAAPARELPFTDPAWKITDPRARVEMLGGQRALRMTTGTAFRRDVQLQDGTVEFDLWSTGERAFAYLHFRMQSEDESEALYFRLHKTRLPDSVQYDPFYQGVGNWQLFHGPESTAAANLQAGRWIHVRVVLSGEKAAVFLEGAREPVLVIPKLARGSGGGFLALRSFLGVNIKGDVEPPSSFANVVVKPDVVEYDFSKVVEKQSPALPGLVTRFRLSPAFAPGEGPVRALPTTLGAPASWAVTESLPSGLVVLASKVKIPEGLRRYATVASFRVRAAAAGVKRLRLGFSDEVSAFLNGQIVYSGDQRYIFNFPRQEGLIHLDQASLYLPLKQGDNEISLVLSEVFGGWGVMAQFEDPSGLIIEP
ncbi:MAG: hypothetical protein KBH14_05275 [Vicinamibacteria bacterium]|nr:hypothetical protein [Vicinamibacteria bacterium]